MQQSTRFLTGRRKLWSTLACGFLGGAIHGVPAVAQRFEPSMNPPSLGNIPDTNTSRDRFGSNAESLMDRDAIFWSKSEFTIPFHVDAAGKQPAEVQLELSTDGGQSWSLYARDSLQARQFRFSATQDGMYLFRIKTIDEFGQSYDPGGQPLKIWVDTKSPELRLTIDTDPQGRMVADFSMIESNPNFETLRLEYQTEQSQRWLPIEFQTNRGAESEIVGRGVWDVPASARSLVVRCIARDAAGNESEVTRLPTIPKTAFGMSGLQLASNGITSRSAPSPQAIPRVGGIPKSAPTNVAGPQLLNYYPKTNATGSPTPSTIGKPYANAPTPAKGAPLNSLPMPNTPIASTASVSRYPLQSMTDEKLTDVTSLKKNSPNDGALYLEPEPSATGANNGTLKSFQGSSISQYDRLEPPLGTAQSITDKPFYSNSLAFSLDYELELDAASLVSSVELWGTIDRGQTWERWGTDPDNQSPFDIKVETEGLFGFRMVVIGANGLAGNRPRNGDNADAWIHVDTEKPTARIQSALYGKGADANSLVIEFSAQDSFFGERPITLSFSELPTGPWTTIVNGLKNTGRYVWPADPTLPRRVYLKLDAHDEAGNIGEHRLDVPVDIEGLAPRGRIQGIRPITK